MGTLTQEYGIDVPFNQPFFSGGSPSAPDVPGRFQVAINGVGYIIEPTKYRRTTLPLRREPTDQSVEPGEQSLNPQGLWRRSQDNWFLGAGQEYLDNRFAFVSVYTHSGEDPSVRTRFWRSKGINPWVEGKLELLPEYLAKKSTTGTGTLCAFVNGYLYYWDGTSLFYTANPTAANPTWTTVAYPSGAGLAAWPVIQSIATDGYNVFLACGSYGVITTVAGTATSSLLRATGPTPTVAPSVAGSTTWSYYIVATDANGFKSLVSAVGQTTTGDANLAQPLSGPPTGLAIATVGTGGSTTYGYRVSATNAAGETLACVEVTIANGNSVLNASHYNALSWNAVAGATGYKVYGRTAAGELYMATVTGGATTYNDQGGATPSGALPTSDTTDSHNLVTWAAVNGAVSYDVLRGDTGHSVATGVLTTSYTDYSASTTAYTAPAANTKNLQATFVEYGMGFLVAGSGALLAEVLRDGMTSLIWTHPNPNFNWQAGGAAPVAMYVAGSAGNASELYAIQVNPTTGALTAPYIAGAVTEGEIIRSVLPYENIVVVTTSLGVRTGQTADSSGHLTMGPVITDPGDVKCSAVYGAYTYFGWTDFSTNDGVYPTAVTSTGLGRLFLSEFTNNPLLPAYATDVMATDAVTGTVTSVAVDGAGNAYFCVDGNGIWGPNGSNLVASGFIEPGWVRYGLVNSKTIVNIDVRHDPLNGTVGLGVVPFGAGYQQLATSETAGSIGPADPFTANLLAGEAFMPIITLNRLSSDHTKGPVLRRWTVAAFPVVSRQDEILVPIKLGKDVMSPARQGNVESFDPLETFQAIKQLETSGTVVTYQEGNASYTCIIDQVEVQPLGWEDDFEFFKGLLMVKLITLDN